MTGVVKWLFPIQLYTRKVIMMPELNLDAAWELVQELNQLREKNKELSQERDRWQEIAEQNNWPFEWEIATGLKAEKDKLRHTVVVMQAALLEIQWNCQTYIVFDENGEPSEFPDAIKDIVDLILIDYPRDSGIDFAKFEASEFKLGQDALRICESALKIAIETFDDDAPGSGITEREALRRMRRALDAAHSRLYIRDE